ncbi:11404_t:CDS:2 [Dentiscutata heterogama]|uniref:11404_t:CDS:1 n=1 Tax=Dentiscutata heterogama TaxID=1316150 RepID=A0ACA9KYL1_9GLOM|nr:11404_t:CDS:2 [Dentiscutata heterogama]
MWIDTSSFELINGTIAIASFNNNNSCTLNSVPINTVILLVPFNEGLNYGCSSYADIIENNLWLQTTNKPISVNATVISSSPSTAQSSNHQSTVTNEYIATNSPTNTKNHGSSVTMIDISYETESLTRPNKRVVKEHIKPRNIIKSFSFDSLNSQPQIKVVIFTSMNNGDPGIKENYVGNLETLSKVAPVLTLMRIADMKDVHNLSDQISYAVIIPDSGPWINLLNSKTFLIWTLISGILYGSILIISLGLILWGVYKRKFSLDNPKPWLLAGIVICATTRKNDLVPIVEPNAPRNNEQNGRTSQRNNEQIMRVRINKKIFETGVLTISLILSFLFITVRTLVTAFLNPTIRNFWITRITDDVSFIIGFIVLLITLHSDSISKYSHMTYASSPEESSTENSQNPSRSSSNGGNIQDRPRRNTLEILFGRRSIVGL